jgi:hypothetical protein
VVDRGRTRTCVILWASRRPGWLPRYVLVGLEIPVAPDSTGAVIYRDERRLIRKRGLRCRLGTAWLLLSLKS